MKQFSPSAQEFVHASIRNSLIFPELNERESVNVLSFNHLVYADFFFLSSNSDQAKLSIPLLVSQERMVISLGESPVSPELSSDFANHQSVPEGIGVNLYFSSPETTSFWSAGNTALTYITRFSNLVNRRIQYSLGGAPYSHNGIVCFAPDLSSARNVFQVLQVVGLSKDPDITPGLPSNPEHCDSHFVIRFSSESGGKTSQPYRLLGLIFRFTDGKLPEVHLWDQKKENEAPEENSYKPQRDRRGFLSFFRGWGLQNNR